MLLRRDKLMHACASCSHDCRAALEQHDVCCLQQLLLLLLYKPFAVLRVLSVLRCSAVAVPSTCKCPAGLQVVCEDPYMCSLQAEVRYPKAVTLRAINNSHNAAAVASSCNFRIYNLQSA